MNSSEMTYVQASPVPARKRGRFATALRWLRWPVVSVGNLSVGGTGKTPFTIAVARMLMKAGVHVDVLSRGYGRKSTATERVDPQGTAELFGDEPLLIARKLRVPVIVGEDRYAAGQFAEQKFGPRLHLLDDGFQHRALARDFDIVLVTPEDARDRLLPGFSSSKARRSRCNSRMSAAPCGPALSARDAPASSATLPSKNG